MHLIPPPDPLVLLMDYCIHNDTALMPPPDSLMLLMDYCTHEDTALMPPPGPLMLLMDYCTQKDTALMPPPGPLMLLMDYCTQKDTALMPPPGPLILFMDYCTIRTQLLIPLIHLMQSETRSHKLQRSCWHYQHNSLSSLDINVSGPTLCSFSSFGIRRNSLSNLMMYISDCVACCLLMI